MRLSELTIKQYVHLIFRKPGTTDRTQLATWALSRQRAESAAHYERVLPALGRPEHERQFAG